MSRTFVLLTLAIATLPLLVSSLSSIPSPFFTKCTYIHETTMTPAQRQQCDGYRGMDMDALTEFDNVFESAEYQDTVKYLLAGTTGVPGLSGNGLNCDEGGVLQVDHMLVCCCELSCSR